VATPSTTSSVEQTVADKPSIAVLPFDNLSGDPEQDYFSDGMAEDLITDLSKLSNLSVAARNSSFSFKSQMPEVREVAEKLGVSFVLEGSVRKMGDRLRINAQLIGGADGRHIWAERYDGEMAEIFDFQDRIRGEILEALALQLTPSDQAVTAKRRTVDIEAYDFYLKGRALYFRYTEETYVEAINCFEKAIELDPDFADAYGYLSYCYMLAWVLRWPGIEKNLTDALAMAEKGVSLDPGSAVAHTRLGWILGFARRFDESVESFEKSLSLDPNLSETYSYYGEILNYGGFPEKGLQFTEKSIELDDFAPPTWTYHVGMSYFELNRLEEAVVHFEAVVRRAPRFLPARIYLTCTLAELGRIEDAQAQFKAIGPEQSECRRLIFDTWPYRDNQKRERLLTALHKAGFEAEDQYGAVTSAANNDAVTDKPSIGYHHCVKSHPFVLCYCPEHHFHIQGASC
jgi:TolB-like protein